MACRTSFSHSFPQVHAPFMVFWQERSQRWSAISRICTFIVTCYTSSVLDFHSFSAGRISRMNFHIQLERYHLSRAGEICLGNSQASLLSLMTTRSGEHSRHVVDGLGKQGGRRKGMRILPWRRSSLFTSRDSHFARALQDFLPNVQIHASEYTYLCIYSVGCSFTASETNGHVLDAH